MSACSLRASPTKRGSATAHSDYQRTQEGTKADSAKAAPTCRRERRGSLAWPRSQALASPAADGLAAQPLRPTGPKPNAPSPWPRSWAASTPPPRSWGTTWPSLRKALTHHGLGMPARNPEAVRRRAIAAARHRSGQPAPQATQPLDLVFMALNHGQLPPPRGPQPEQGVRLRRAEEIETLSYRTVVALNQESRLAPRWRIATIARRAERRQAERAARTRHSSRAHHWPEERGMLTDAR
jgi:hypothetical protein